MAATAATLAAALGITVADAADDTDTGIVEATRLLAIAGPLVDAYLRGGTDCPAAVRDEAVIRTAGHVQDRRTFGAQSGRVKVGGVQMDLSPAAAGRGPSVGRRRVAGAVREADRMIELGIGQPPRRPEIRTDATSLAINLLTAAVGTSTAQTWAAGAVEPPRDCGRVHCARPRCTASL